jgi:hypothetical protein
MRGPACIFWANLTTCSLQTTATVNGAAVAAAQLVPGKYLAIERTWRAGDKVVLGLDFRLRCWEQVPLAHAAAAAPLCGPCGAPAAPKPVWSAGAEGGWPTDGKVFGPGGAARDKSDCHFRKTATEYDREPGIKRLRCTAK